MNNPPHRKPSQRTIVIREVLSQATRPYDYDKLLAVIRARLGYKAKLTKAHLRKEASKIRLGKISTEPTTNGRAKPPVAPPPPDAYTVNELQTARAFLTRCGDSLHRATTLLKTVADLTLKEK